MLKIKINFNRTKNQKKKKLNLKIDKMLNFWSYVCFLRKNGLLIFCQNLSLNARTELSMYRYFSNDIYTYKFLPKNIINNIMQKKMLVSIKYFSNILILKNIFDLFEVEQILKEKNILVLGYYIQNVFFHKNDLNIKKIEKIKVIDNLKKRMNIFKFLTIKLINNLKNSLLKLIRLIKKIKN